MRSVNTSTWFANKAFTTDWTSPHFTSWTELLTLRRGQALEMLEIGSWEGRSAIFFLNYLPLARLTCIDTFVGSPEHHQVAEWAAVVGDIERRFDDNLAEFAGRVRKIKAVSHAALAELALQSKRYDLVYVDGSHRAVDVYADAVLSWPLVNPGGMMIFDDYTWTIAPDPADRPKMAIDAFLADFAGEYREVHRGLQIAIVKNGTLQRAKNLFRVALSKVRSSLRGDRSNAA